MLLALLNAQYLRDMGGADVPRNSSLVVYQITSGQAFWLIFAWAWVFAQVVARDHAAGLDEVVLTAPVSLRGLLFARYVGALALACLLGSSSSFALLLVPALGALGAFPASAVGPTPIAAIGHAWLWFTLPSAIGLGALYVVAALRTKSSAGPFATSAVVILLWMGAMVVLRSADVRPDLATLLDVSGFGEAEHQTKLWTPAEKSSALMEMTGPLLWNRALWTLGPLSLFGLVSWRLRREELVLERGSRLAPRVVRAVARVTSAPPLGPVTAPSWLKATWRDAGWQATQLMSGRPFILAMALWMLLNVAAPFVHMLPHAEGPLVPRGQILAPFLVDFCFIFSVFGSAGFVGTLVRRDRRAGLAEVIDATPAPLGVRVVASALAAASVTLVFVFVPTFSAWITMALAIPKSFDFWSPLLVNGMVAAPALLELSAITFAIHALVRSSGTAYALSMFAALVAVVNHELGIVSYPPGKIGIPAHVQLSELAGFSPWLAPVAALDALKLASVASLFALAWLAYSRGTALTASVRLREAWRRLRGGAGALASVSLLLVVAATWLLHDRIVRRGAYRSAEQRERDDAAWERKFWNRAGPFTITEGDVEATVDPRALRARVVVRLRGVRSETGRLQGELPGGTRFLTAHVGASPRRVTTELEHFELELGPCPSGGCEVTLSLDIAADGWNLHETPAWMHASGIWARAADLVPRFGVDAERKHRSPALRRTYGLPEDSAPLAASALVPARGVASGGRFRWKVQVTEPGAHTAFDGEVDGALDFAFAWLPAATGEVSSRHGLEVWHGATRAEVAQDVAEDVRALRSCVEMRTGLPVEVDTVLQAPRGLGDVALHGRVLWLPEQQGWDVGAGGVGHTKRRATLGRALAASALARSAKLRVEPGSRFLTAGVAGFVGLACVRELDGADAWLAWMARGSDHVVEELGALDAPLVSLADDGDATWVEQYAPLATLGWARARSPEVVRATIQSLTEHLRAGKPVREALALVVGAEQAKLLLGAPRAADVSIAREGARVEVRGERSRWVAGGWQAEPHTFHVSQQLEDGSTRIVELPLLLEENARATVFDAEPSFERSPLDNAWPRPSRSK